MEVKFNSALLPLRDIVVFPSMVIPLFVGRDKSISALNEVMKKDKKIILVTQKNSEIDGPKKTDIFIITTPTPIDNKNKPTNVIKFVKKNFNKKKYFKRKKAK